MRGTGRRSRNVSTGSAERASRRVALGRKSTLRDDGTQMEQLRPSKRRRVATASTRRRSVTIERTSDGADAANAMATQLRSFAIETVTTGVDGLVREFAELRTITIVPPPKSAFEANADKNRYKDVICGDNSRVVLTWPIGAPDYVHANRVPIRGEKKFICTQGPKQNTVDDFWRLIWQEKCRAIVMLCGVMELGKKKCEQYWPEKPGETMTCANVTIKNLDVTEPEKVLTVCKLEISVDGETSLACQHFLWNGWPDRGVPENFMACLRLLAKLKTFNAVVVHCSAGIGRTGTIVGLEMAQQTVMNGDRLKFFDLVKDLRTHRHGSVQTDVQYVYMHRVMLGLAENKKVVKHDEIAGFYDAYESYIKEKGATG